jgi:RNA ligase
MRDLPYSNRIEPYLEAIAGCDAFFVADRDYGRIINYRQMGSDVFPDPAKAPDPHTAWLWGLRRQCRGIIFDLDGNVISPGFEKFRNVNECEETLLAHVPFELPHVILAKEDGSLCRPIPMRDGSYRLGTKMGITDVAAQPEAWVAKNPHYHRFITHCVGEGWTPLFEWCSRRQRIVIDYPVDRLILLAIRNVANGTYMPLNMMLELAGEYGVETVRRYSGTLASMTALVEETRGLQDQEGWVIWFENGYRLKIKGDAYVAVHRAKEGILRENAVIEMILDEATDDVKALLPDEDRERLQSFEDQFWAGVHHTAGVWEETFQHIKSVYGDDRKRFALENSNQLEGHLRSAVFKAWDSTNFDWHEWLLGTIRKQLSTLVKTDAARHLWGGAMWTYHQVGDE